MNIYKLIQVTAKSESLYAEIQADTIGKACQMHVHAYKHRPFVFALVMELPNGERHSYFDSEKLAA